MDGAGACPSLPGHAPAIANRLLSKLSGVPGPSIIISSSCHTHHHHIIMTHLMLLVSTIITSSCHKRARKAGRGAPGTRARTRGAHKGTCPALDKGGAPVGTCRHASSLGMDCGSPALLKEAAYVDLAYVRNNNWQSESLEDSCIYYSLLTASTMSRTIITSSCPSLPGHAPADADRNGRCRGMPQPAGACPSNSESSIIKTVWYAGAKHHHIIIMPHTPSSHHHDTSDASGCFP